ncbi:hypothetical protein CYCD_12250 [Tenuifilaceae bacterium CYCD]|nr:hypothetical protein CYCD_12250 [Tenuifilaceae bacterium CYCD]
MKHLFSLLLTVVSLNIFGQVSYDFENNDLSNWTQKPSGKWQISTTSPISGTRSLKQTYDNTAAHTDTIYTALPAWNVNTGYITWRMLVKYGYDPSSSNCWWIYIMADDQVMTATNNGSGYVVGVNLSASDDLLKLWRIDNGTPTPIITSTLNWQAQIGTSKAGAIEIVRSTDGTITLRASANGTFADLTEYGSINDIAHVDFQNFGILYRYTASADMKLWIDNISINYEPINVNDTNSTANAPSSQIKGGSISSLAINAESAVDVFRFVAEDFGTTDNLPTMVKKIVIKNLTETPWSGTIGGVRIKGLNGDIPINSFEIKDDAIDIYVDSTLATIPDGNAAEYTLGVYLTENTLIDGTKLQFYVDSTDHGFAASFTGSDFAAKFPAAIISNEFTVEVEATKLSFTQSPQVVGINKPFSATVEGYDSQRNLDKDFMQEVTLELNEGDGLLTSASGLTTTASGGIATWSDLTYNKSEIITLKATSINLESAITSSIAVINDTTSTALTPLLQPQSSSVSSLLTSPAKALEAMRFRISDSGDGDNVPTIVKSIRLSRTSIQNIATLNKTIEGVLVKKDGVLCGISSVQIKSSYIDIFFTSESMVIPDGSSTDISIWLYLKSEGLTDNQTIQLMVDRQNHAFTAHDGGSTFASQFPENITSNIFTIDVKATDLAFTQIPDRVGVQENFSVGISATDINQNIDKDLTGQVTLALASGTGTLSSESGFVDTLINGSTIYSNVNYSTPGKFSLLAQSPTLNDIASAYITCGDIDGETKPLTNNEDTLNILLISSGIENPIEIIRFMLKDGGTSDNLPLIPTSVVLSIFDTENAGSIAKMIKCFAFKIDDKLITPRGFTLLDNKFTINIDKDSLLIENGDSAEVSALIYLDEIGVTDNTSFRFLIPTSHGWESSSNGTAFSPTFTSTIYGQPCNIEVEASRLSIAESPFIVSADEPISIKAAAINAYGNFDEDYLGYADISLNSGPGQMDVSSIRNIITAGLVVWNDVKLDSYGQFQIKANYDELGSCLTPSIYSGYNYACSISEDFEENAPAWTGIGNWKTSTISPISGTQSLIHAGNPGDGENTLLFPLGTENILGNPVEWEFTIQNGDWDPSSDNYFYFIAAASSLDLNSSATVGLAVGINPSSNNDSLSLWSFAGTKRTNLIVTPFDWNENDEVRVRLTLSPLGKLSLWYQPNQSKIMLFGGETNLSNQYSLNFAGFVFGYTASRAGQLWIDNLKICTAKYPPILQSAKSLNLTTVKVDFTQNVTAESASQTQNYQIKTSSGVIIPAIKVTCDSEKQNEVILTTDKMPLGDLTLTVQRVKNEDGYYLTDSTAFGIGAEGNLGRLIINEIMANPIPSNGLPEYEYIELFNPTNDTVNVQGWKMHFNSTVATLPLANILPKNYEVICTSTAAANLSEYGQAIGVTGFPSLLNDGMLLKLFDNKGNLISFADYNKTWYNDNTRNSGGYSLECIDPSNLAEGINNWHASLAQIGGTPCAANSVANSNPDITKPNVVSLDILDDKTLEVLFNEPMDSLTLTLAENYSIDNEIGNPSEVLITGELFDKVKISFSNPIAAEQIYELTISDEVKDFVGNALDFTQIKLGLPQVPSSGDLVINEILFNPYTGGVDFVELYNNSSKCLDLSKINIANRNLTDLSISQSYPASDTARLLFQNEFVVITENPELVKQFYQCQNPSAFIWASSLASLNNDEGYVVMLTENNNVVDEVHYTEEMHSKMLNDYKGISLERINPNLSSADASTWQSASQVVGFATPTYKNSQYTDATTSTSSFTLTPETFSPDGDGKDDFLLINYNLPEAGFVANIKVYTSNGVEIYRLANNLLLGTEGTIRWDGINFSNSRVPVGLYIIYIEYFNLKGEVKKEKKVCVVASRG